MSGMNQPLLERLQSAWTTSFLLRWTLANVLGWTAGLYLIAWSFSTPVFCLGGGLAGVIVGAAQWTVLRREYFLSSRTENEQSALTGNWIVLSAIGGLLGLLPAMVAGLLVTFGWGVGIALVGGALGAGLGIGQWFRLNGHMGRAGWWILANVGGGAACALLTLAPLIRGLPLGLLIGTAVYGYVTGRALAWLQTQE
jgi:hypothetical protein